MDGDQRTVSADAITVTKHLDTDRFNTPAVVLEITSTADRKTPVTVTEPIPDSFPIENIGFHPEFGSEHWSISDGRIVFDRTLDPGGEYTTVYGIRKAGDDELRTFLDSETSVSTGNGVAPGQDDAGDGSIEELLLEGEDETVREVIAAGDDSLGDLEAGTIDDPEEQEREADIDEPETGDPDESEEVEPNADTPDPQSESADGSETEDTDESDDQEPTGDTDESETEGVDESEVDVIDEVEVETGGLGENSDGLDRDDFVALGAEEVGGLGTQDEAGDPGETTGDYRRLPDSVAEALAGEIRDGSISEENMRVLREAFSKRTQSQRNVDLRIKQLQTQVADLTAYTDEFERFLDEYGSGDSAVNSLEESLSDVASRVGELEDSLETVDEQATEIESRLEATRDELEDRAETVDSLEDRVTNVETDVDDLLYLEEDVMALEAYAETVSDLEEAVETLNAEMERMKGFRDRLTSAFGPDGDRIGEQDDG
jgi:methyl-accepting chemotaxis protein